VRRLAVNLATIGKMLTFWFGLHQLKLGMESSHVEQIYNYLQISEAIATAGQPTAEQFSAIRDANYDLVINLALPTSTNAIPNEREIVENLDLRYIHIPVEWEQPTLQNATIFFETLQANADQRVFVHCAMNMRVSAFMFLYRVIYQGVPEQEAEKLLQRIWMPNQTWRQFMELVIKSKA
jgi:protein tyrosine phosphatase (PTP) superfamily phosphohydrolase (DUF442 family)